MLADTGNPAAFQHNDAVCIHDGADALRHDQNRGFFGFILQRGAELCVGFKIEG